MTSVAIYSHALGAAVLALVSLTLTLNSGVRKTHPWLLAGFWMTAVWASFLAVAPLTSWLTPFMLLQLSVVKAVCWCLCLGNFLKTGHYAQRVFGCSWSKYLKSVFLIGSGVIFVTFWQWPGLRWSLVGHLFISLLGLYLAEQLFQNARREYRPTLLALALCAGTLFAGDFYINANYWFYVASEPLSMYRHGPFVLIATIFAISIIWSENWDENLKLGGTFSFQSFALLAGVSFLVLNGLISTAWHLWGGSVEDLIALIFGLCLAGILIASFFSEFFKKRVSKFFNPNLVGHEYNWREEWSRFSYMLSNEQHQMDLPERVIFSMASMIGANGGVLYEAQKNRFVLSAQWGMSPKTEAQELPASLGSICKVQANVIERVKLSHPDRQWFDEHWPRTAYLVPLIYNNVVVAVLCLRKPSGDFTLSREVLSLLKTAGAQAAVSLAENRNAEALSQARQFEGFNRLSTFMMHDVKNIIMQLSLTLANAEKHRDNPEFIDSMLKTIGASVQHLEQMVQQLQSGQSKQLPKVTPFRVMPVVQSVMEERGCSEPVPKWTNLVTDETLNVLGSEKRFRSVLRNLIHNAQEATPRQGRVKVSSEVDKGYLTITIEDSGCGMSEHFIKNGLFNPFVTTKGSCGMGIGAYEAKAYMQAIGGKIHVHSVLGKGTRFTLKCPLAVSIVTSPAAS